MMFCGFDIIYVIMYNYIAAGQKRRTHCQKQGADLSTIAGRCPFTG